MILGTLGDFVIMYPFKCVCSFWSIQFVVSFFPHGSIVMRMSLDCSQGCSESRDGRFWPSIALYFGCHSVPVVAKALDVVQEWSWRGS